MANKQGANQVVDSYIGDKLIEARYIGQTKYFDAYTEIAAPLPLSFDARAAGALKNYRLYGTSAGAGVQTENLISKDAFLNNYIMTEYYLSIGVMEFDVEPNTTYWIKSNYFGDIATWYITNTIGSVLDGNTNGILSENTPRSVTSSSSGKVYVWGRVNGANKIVQNMTNSDYIMLVKSDTAPTSYIPPGYKIPILNTSGVTENLYDIATQIVGEGLGYDGITPASTTSNRSDYISVNSNTAYTLWHNTTDSISRMIQFLDSSKTFFANTPPTSDTNPMTFTTPENCAYIRIAYPNTSTEVMLVKGSTPPDHYIPHRYESNYDLFIGSSKLGEDEYLDHQEQKIYKMVSGVLTPVDPPAPLPAIQAYKGENTISSTEEVGEMTVKGRARPYVYGFKIDQSVSDPATAVAYLADAVGKTPAAMGSTTFSYGDWADAFFMPRPCMLKSDGTVDYYLDPDDYTKKADGTASDVGDLTYDGNAMMEWPKIWYKFEEDGDGNVYFFCSYAKVDDSYHCWCNYDANNNIIPHFYTAIYNGIIRDNKMRSLSGFRLTPAIGTIPAYDGTKTYAVGALCKVSSTAYTCITAVTTAEPFDSSKWQEITPNNNGGTAGQTEVNAAVANNPANTNAWYIDVYADRQLISALLILMGKSRNDQGVFGRGLDSGGQTAKEAYVTGTLDDKGLFWGVIANGNSAVKVFGMENWYGCAWRRTAGLIGITVDNVTKYAYKLTYGTADGSTVASYGSTSTGYLITEGRPASHNWVKEMSAGKHGMLPKEVSSSSSYYTVYFYTGTGYALFGGYSNNGLTVGSLFVNLPTAFSYAYWYLAGALSCKPPKPSAS